MVAKYIGDGVYVEFDGFFIRIYTSDGFEVTNQILLEPEVVANLLEFIHNLNKRDSE
jgi:hypothetical protein